MTDLITTGINRVQRMNVTVMDPIRHTAISNDNYSLKYYTPIPIEYESLTYNVLETLWVFYVLFVYH